MYFMVELWYSCHFLTNFVKIWLYFAFIRLFIVFYLNFAQKNTTFLNLAPKIRLFFEKFENFKKILARNPVDGKNYALKMQ